MFIVSLWTDFFAVNRYLHDCHIIIVTLQIKQVLLFWQKTPWSQFTVQSCSAPFQNQLHWIKETYHQQQYGGWYVWLHLVEQKFSNESHSATGRLLQIKLLRDHLKADKCLLMSHVTLLKNSFFICWVNWERGSLCYRKLKLLKGNNVYNYCRIYKTNINTVENANT